jgi:hypothetical protein
MYNGNWSKKGHTASYGFVIPVETGQVLDYGFDQRFVLRVTNRRQIRIWMNTRYGMISYSSNQNESLNGIVWSKAPKHKYKGPKGNQNGWYVCCTPI